jgi:hypothetical protein
MLDHLVILLLYRSDTVRVWLVWYTRETDVNHTWRRLATETMQPHRHDCEVEPQGGEQVQPCGNYRYAQGVQ